MPQQDEILIAYAEREMMKNCKAKQFSTFLCSYNGVSVGKFCVQIHKHLS
jgi:hypothetical protein